MRVRATEVGYYNGLRIPGTESAEFDVPDDEPKSSWFKPIDGEKKGKAKSQSDGGDNATA